MWIFLSDAFVSIVEDNKCADLVLVRARREKHLQNFLTAEIEDVNIDWAVKNARDNCIEETAGRDYRWRVTLRKDVLSQLMVAHTSNINYPNFKDSIRSDRYHSIASNVWREAGHLQEGGPSGGAISAERYRGEAVL